MVVFPNNIKYSENIGVLLVVVRRGDFVGCAATPDVLSVSAVTVDHVSAVDSLMVEH